MAKRAKATHGGSRADGAGIPKGYRYEKTHERRCVLCGGGFWAARNRRFCSAGCRTEAARIRDILDGKGSGPYATLAGRLGARLAPSSPLSRTLEVAAYVRGESRRGAGGRSGRGR